VAIANEKLTPQACREAGIKEQSYYRWRKEDGGLKLEQAGCRNWRRRTRGCGGW
jgi:nitrate reductase beta subunit